MTSPRQFNTTRWSLVVTAGNAESPQSAAALRELCERYWYPLYAFLRRQGFEQSDGMDAVQGFLTQLLDRETLAADANRGRFRSYLIGALRHFIAGQRRFDQAARRGGEVDVISMDARDAENRFSLEPVDDRDPEQLFDRRWALEVLDRARGRLREESEAKGRGALFADLEPALIPTSGAAAHAETAKNHDMTEGAIKVSLHRMRKRLGELIREEVAETLSDPQDLEDEVSVLLQALS